LLVAEIAIQAILLYVMTGAPGATVTDILGEEIQDPLLGGSSDKIQRQLNLMELMELNLLLEGLDLRDPGCGKDGNILEEAGPANGSVGGCQSAEEGQKPLGGVAIAATDPVAFRIRGTGGLGLDQGSGLKAGGESPDDLQSGATLHVKEFQDHGATGAERGETGQSFGDQEALDRGLLAIEIGTEIEASVGRIDVGDSELLGRRSSEGLLVSQRVEIAGAVGTIGDLDVGIGLDEGLGFAPAGHGALRGLEGHGDHLDGTAAMLDRLQEPTRAFGGMGGGGRG